SELPTRCAILRLPNAPVLDLRRARAVSAEKPPGNGLTMKMDYFASQAMQEYLQREITRHAEYADHEVCDAGFWDVDTSTDAGLGWHNDFNWNGFLRADNRSYHGWFVNSRTDDCNFTLAVSTDPRFNECNAAVRTKIFYVAGNDVIEPDIVVP